jgi:hypothetical protein
MTPAHLAEARRWTALRGWRWMPGMLAVRDDGTPYRLSCAVAASKVRPDHGWLPDLTDPATCGCLLALAREITGRPWLYASYSHMSGCWFCGWTALAGDSESKAWLVACERHEAQA